MFLQNRGCNRSDCGCLGIKIDDRQAFLGHFVVEDIELFLVKDFMFTNLQVYSEI